MLVTNKPTNRGTGLRREAEANVCPIWEEKNLPEEDGEEPSMKDERDGSIRREGDVRTGNIANTNLREGHNRSSRRQ